MPRIFILSPAKTSGERANLIYNPKARFDLARRLHEGQAVPLGEIFSFLSGLYFRGKLRYAKAFARPPRGIPGILTITSNRGLLPTTMPISLEELRCFGSVEIDQKESRYREPLQRGADALAAVLSPRCDIVFLGSISSKKYVEHLVEPFGSRLKFPIDFIGRGDMSRGGLLLRSAAEGRELPYASVIGATRHGKRPPKLEPRTWGYRILAGEPSN